MTKPIIEIVADVLEKKSAGKFMVDKRRSYSTPHNSVFVIVGTPESRISALDGMAEEVEQVLAYNGVMKKVAYRKSPSRFEIDHDNPPRISLRDQWSWIKKLERGTFDYLSFFTYRGSEQYPRFQQISDGCNVHTLFCGATRSGKTVAAQCALTTLMMLNSPEILSVYLCDPNGTGFSYLEGCPHVVRRLAVSNDEIIDVFREVHAEMDRRAAMRSLSVNNTRVLVVLDEMTNQLTRNDGLAEYIESIGQRGGGLGINMFGIGQKVTAGISPSIQANFSARVVGRLNSANDAKLTCHEESQAHKLPVRRGRFEFRNGDTHDGNEVLSVFSYYVDPGDHSFYAKEISDRWKGHNNHMSGVKLMLLPGPTDDPQPLSLIPATPSAVRRIHREQNGVTMNYKRAVRLWQEMTGMVWKVERGVAYA